MSVALKELNHNECRFQQVSSCDFLAKNGSTSLNQTVQRIAQFFMENLSADVFPDDKAHAVNVAHTHRIAAPHGNKFAFLDSGHGEKVPSTTQRTPGVQDSGMSGRA